MPRHFPAVLGGQELPHGCRDSGRLQLAEWLTDPQNPLTARVMVNRIWQHHFGKGIVPTPNDFGRQGKPPTHPELLDFLAARFVESGWSIKAMHRLILLSHDLAARQRRRRPRTLQAAIPNNELFWKFDAPPAGCGIDPRHAARRQRRARRTPGGAHPFPPQHTGIHAAQPVLRDLRTRRRSVYLMQQRLRKHPYLALFDGADPEFQHRRPTAEHHAAAGAVPA